MRKLAFVLILFLYVQQVRADFLLETTGSYLTDSTAVTNTDTSSRTVYNIGLLFTLSKSVWGGWNYMGLSQSDTVTNTTTTYSTVDTGPSIKYFFGKGDVFSLSATYNFTSKASYQSGTASSQDWTGTSYLIAFGMNPEVTEGLHIGVTLNYYAAAYTKKVISSTESSTSNSKSMVFPALSLTKAW